MFSRDRGFTIVELLVVVAVMAILLAIVIPNLTRFLPAQRLTSGMNQMMGELRLTRQKAIAEGNDFVVYCPLPSDTSRYKVHNNDDNDRTPQEDAGEEVLILSLPSQVYFASVKAFTFKSDGTVIETDGSPASAFSIVLKARRGGEDSLSVLPSGMVMKW